MARDKRDEGRYFHDSTPEIVGNIFTNRDRDEIQDYSSRASDPFVAFTVITNWEAGVDRDGEPREGSTSFKVKANGAWAKYILDNPEVFAFGERVRVRGNLETESYTYERTVKDVDGEEVTIEETRHNNVINIGKFDGFIAPDMRFKDAGDDDGGRRGGGRRTRRRDDDYDDNYDDQEGFEGDEDDEEDEAPRRRSRGGGRGSDSSSRGGSRRRASSSEDDGDDSGRGGRRRSRGGESRRRGRGRGESLLGD